MESLKNSLRDFVSLREQTKTFGEYLGMVVPTEEKLKQWRIRKPSAI